MSIGLKKQNTVQKMVRVLQNYSTVLILRNNGITAQEVRFLRLMLHSIGGGALVIKNTLFCIAVDQSSYSDTIKLSAVGPNLIVYSDDILVLLKNIIDFLKDGVKLEVISCYHKAEAIKKDDIYELSKISSIDEVYNRLYVSLNMPLFNFYCALNSAGIPLLHALQEYKKNFDNN